MTRERSGMWQVGVATAWAWTCLAGVGLAQPTVVMRGLDNPRGLAFGPEGALYVAEAGRGGGRAVRHDRNRRHRLCRRQWRHLPALEGRAVAHGLGPAIVRAGQRRRGERPPEHCVPWTRRQLRDVRIGGGPTYRAALGEAGEALGTLVRMSASGQWKVQADLVAYEMANNPAGGIIDSNPFGALAVPAGCVVTDAGSNTLLGVAANGAIETLAVFPSRPNASTDAVPTGVVIGPDGAYYVSQLTGAPFTTGAANVYRVVPGEAPTVYRSGFKTITDLAFASDGSLYVVEVASGPGLSMPGRLLRVNPDDTRVPVLIGLDRPTSVAIGPDGAIYVTNHGSSPGIGEVLRVQ